MKTIVTIAFSLLLFVRAFAQAPDTSQINVALTQQEITYIHNALGDNSSQLLSSKNKMAQQVDQLILSISSQSCNQLDGDKDINLKLSISAVQYIVNVVAGYPWRDVYQLMPKLMGAAAAKKDEQKPEGNGKE